MPNGPWFNCLPRCVAQVPCGQGRHAVRWEAGSLRLPEHPDAEGEMVLAALGGEKAGCVELAEAWGRHADDLSVLAIGPRGAADEIAVSWDDVAAAAQVGRGGWVGYRPGQPRPMPAGPMPAGPMPAGPMPPGPMPPGAMPPGPMPPGAMPPGPMPPAPMPAGPMALASSSRALSARAAHRHRQVQEEMEQVRRRRSDMLSLLALGYGFQVRLIGQVAAAHADQPDERVRPALIAAIAGRLAPVAEDWLGIDPDQVVVSLHSGPGWGSVELTGRGEERRLRVSLPAGWLASVWACGLALTGRHLVVAVQQAGWPDARVLGLRAPGAEPVPLDVHGSGGARGGPADATHWEV